MSAQNTGGPAFPSADLWSSKRGEWVAHGTQGLSLRDYFAAKAMQAAATNPVGADGFSFEERANWAYQQADSMLKARES